MQRRRFMQLLVGLLIFRPKMRAEEQPNGVIVLKARSLGYTSMVSCRECRFFSFRSIGGEKGKHFVTESACVRRGLPVSPKGLCMEYQAKGQRCPRCGIGRDTDGDGNCAFCARLTDDQVEHIYAYGKTLQPMAEECLKRNIGRVAERPKAPHC